MDWRPSITATSFIVSIFSFVAVSFICAVLAFGTGRIWLTPSHGPRLSQRFTRRAIAAGFSFLVYLIWGLPLIFLVWTRTRFDRTVAWVKVKWFNGPAQLRTCRLVKELLTPYSERWSEDDRAALAEPLSDSVATLWFAVFVSFPHCWIRELTEAGNSESAIFWTFPTPRRPAVEDQVV
jgi:hypothetical protein